MTTEAAKAMATPAMVTVCATQRGMTRQNRPAIMPRRKWRQRNQQIELLHFHV
jgi:hypothetical protein